MKHPIHIPTFLAATFCLLLGLWLQTSQSSAEEVVFSIIFLMMGFGLFFYSYRISSPKHINDKPVYAKPVKMALIVILVGTTFWFFAGGMYTKVFHFLGGLLPQTLVK